MNSAQNTMTLRQATLLALTVLCVYYPITIYFTLPTELWRNLPFLIFPALVNFVFYVLLILAIDRIIARAEKWFGPRILQISFATVALSIVVAAVAVLLSILIFRTNIKFWSTLTDLFGTPPGNNKPPQFMWWTTLRRVNYGLTILMSISIYYLILNRKSQQRMADMEMQAAQLRKENAVAQFEALKNQVSPHFLFNSLSILSSLVHVDANLSEQFISQLSKAYRYILEQKDHDTVSLQTELDFLSAYAFLLKIRFENKFDVQVSIADSDARRYRIAPLTLQLLIENCVKHNRMSDQEPLVVSLTIADDYLSVVNPVRPRSELASSTSTGIGLANIRRRYELLTTRPVVVQSDTHFTVNIPLL